MLFSSPAVRHKWKRLKVRPDHVCPHLFVCVSRHNGATGGYSSYAFFNPKGNYAAVILLNATLAETGSYADRIGEHISERLAGKPAISLGD
jgi:hypothetical protein